MTRIAWYAVILVALASAIIVAWERVLAPALGR